MTIDVVHRINPGVHEVTPHFASSRVLLLRLQILRTPDGTTALFTLRLRLLRRKIAGLYLYVLEFSYDQYYVVGSDKPKSLGYLE